MKMVKSLLLGTAAGLVACAVAQAADLPVKAKPVQYVKIAAMYDASNFCPVPAARVSLRTYFAQVSAKACYLQKAQLYIAEKDVDGRIKNVAALEGKWPLVFGSIAAGCG